MWRLKSTALVTPGPELRSRGRAGVCLAGNNTGPKHTAKFCGVMRLCMWKEETRRRWSRRSVSVACGEGCGGGGHKGANLSLFALCGTLGGGLEWRNSRTSSHSHREVLVFRNVFC